MSLIDYSICLLYTGKRKNLSDQIESFYEFTNCKGFNIINVSDPRIKQWLISNQKGIKIRKFPVFLIARQGYPTMIIPENRYNQIRQLLLKLSNTKS